MSLYYNKNKNHNKDIAKGQQAVLKLLETQKKFRYRARKKQSQLKFKLTIYKFIIL